MLQHRIHIFVALSLSQLVAMPAHADEFGKNCTTSLSKGMVVQTDCSISSTFEDKVYCFGSEASKAAFLQNPQATIKQADAFYHAKVETPRIKISQAEALQEIAKKDCDLSNKDLGYLELDKMDLRHCKMVNTSFFGAYLRGANMSGANLQGAYMNLARLEDTDLSNANLQDASIFQAIFSKTNFKGANLANARMIGTLGNVDMSQANIKQGRFGLDIGNQPMGAMRFDAVGGNFANTNFEGADINRSNFQFADFRNANLRHTNLFRADFSKADFTGADITGADLNEAILDGTVMTNVKGLEAIKGYDMAKGKCVDCAVIAESATAKTEVVQNTDNTDQASSGCPLHRRTTMQ